MARVLNLDDFRARTRRVPRNPASGVPESAVYFCNRCAAEQFTLSPRGAVHCAHCGALMRNISVTNPGGSGRRRPPR
jgi:hypothetical protein